MEYKGIAKGNIIELEKPLPFEDGTNIEISVKLMPKPRKGSPKAILQLAGTLTDEEAELILREVQECRSIDQELWR